MENENSVAFIAKITTIAPIEGADKIELAKANNSWTSIVAKNTHKVGDLILCVTTDAVIPEDLATKWGVINYLRKGNRVRTVKLRGVYSECILIQLNSDNIPLKLSERGDVKFLYEGRDMMGRLSIYKYEPPVKQIQLSSGKTFKYKANSNFLVYHKFPNYKNVPDIFKEGDEVVITRKYHGSNKRSSIVRKPKLSFWDIVKNIFKKDPWRWYTFAYGSHQVEKGSDSQGYYSTDVWRTIVDKYDLRTRLWEYVKVQHTPETIGSGIILYGEVYGAGIQKNYDYGLKDIDFKAFDVSINGEFVDHFRFLLISKHELEVPVVEDLYRGPWKKEIQDSFLNDKIEGTNVYHEGVVVKCVTGDKRKRAKVISSEYLIFAEKNNVGDGH